MPPTNDHLLPSRAVRQLRRIRAFYATASSVWAALAVWEGWQHPGSRPMWVSALLLVVFTGLFSVTSLWLSRHEAAVTAAAGGPTRRGSAEDHSRAGGRLNPGTSPKGRGSGTFAPAQRAVSSQS